jgi:hypothetical protein
MKFEWDLAWELLPVRKARQAESQQLVKDKG